MGDGTKLHCSKIKVIHTAGRFEVWFPPFSDGGNSASKAGNTLVCCMRASSALGPLPALPLKLQECANVIINP